MDVFIYGEITDEQSESAAEWGYVSPKTVANQIKTIEGDEIVVRINSMGGSVDAGFAIYDLLRTSGKNITTIIEGQCYSIATVIALAGDERKATENSSFLIHNPWTFGVGDSATLKRTADELQSIENKIAQFYSKRAGNITPELALEEMEKDITMSLETAMEYGFITQIIETVRAVAKFKQMSNEKKVEVPQNFMDKLTALFDKKEGAAKALVVKTADDTDIDFYELEEGASPSIGDMATVDGEEASGSYVMPNGSTYVFDAGALTEMVEAEEEEDEMEMLKNENAALKEQLASVEAKASETSETVEAMASTLKEYTTTMNSVKALVGEVVVETKEDKPKDVEAKKSLFNGLSK